MKKPLIILALLINFQLAFPQGWVYISGTVTDSLSGYPVPAHPVTIMSDSTQGLFYYNVVFTDSAGYYFDDVPVLADSTGIIYVQTADCNGVIHQATIVYNPVNNTYTQDFLICTINNICQASFRYDLLNSLTFQFTDESIGDIISWYWDFGDGLVSGEQNPVHTFPGNGLYIVSLAISNQFTGCFDFFSMEVPVYDSTGGDCQAAFSFIAEPEGSPNYRFIDLSQGTIFSWLWTFGDGTVSEEQNPYHIFPGPGVYNICLSITGYDCASTFCREIAISDTVYQQIYGQVFAWNLPARQGIVQIFSMNPNGSYSPLNDGCPLDSNGIYSFTLVPAGTFVIQAVPYDSSGYLPTYYGDVTTWQTATPIVLGEPENPYNITLIAAPAGGEFFGPGSLSGQIVNLGLQRSLADKANMFLLNEDLTTIGFARVSSSGYFEFPSLEYGVYNLQAELAGVSSDIMKFEITPEQPHLDVVLNYTGNSVLGVKEGSSLKEMVFVYPNPVRDLLNISFHYPVSQQIRIEIYSLTGQLVYRTEELISERTGTISVPFDNLPAGLYTLSMINNNGRKVIMKIIKSK